MKENRAQTPVYSGFTQIRRWIWVHLLNEIDMLTYPEREQYVTNISQAILQG
jgi:hypothetical protein